MTSLVSFELTDLDNLANENVSVAMQRIFDTPDIFCLDLADGLKQLLFDRNCNLDFLLQSDAATVAQELGIENYVAQIIINAAKRATTE